MPTPPPDSLPVASEQLDDKTAAMGLESVTPDLYIPVGVLVQVVEKPQPTCAYWTTLIQGYPEVFCHLGSNEKILKDLSNAQWIHVTFCRHRTEVKAIVYRVYVLPYDVRRRDIPRSNPSLTSKLQGLIERLDTTPEAWNGHGAILPGDLRLLGIRSSEKVDNDSLFYIFNTIESPKPNPDRLTHAYDRKTARKVLSGSHDFDLGFASEPYAHQRRSIVTMMEREVQPRATPDPRLQRVVGPTGREYFYDFPNNRFFAERPTYTDVRGGILAETMGIGKTYIVLGLILATKYQMPDIPLDAVVVGSSYDGLGAKSISNMIMHAIRRHNLNWRQELEDEEEMTGASYPKIVELMERPYLYKQLESMGYSGTRKAPVVREILLCRTTLVVVPSNLFRQWQHEISRHVAPGKLSFLAVDERYPQLPSKFELAEYQMILMEKTRFTIEIRARAPPKNDTITHRSFPLEDMHFLRVVIDEGHGFARTGSSNTAVVSVKRVRADRVWIVTGTPSSGLIGVEIDSAADQHEKSVSRPEDVLLAQIRQNDAVLSQRQWRLEGDNEDLRRLGRIVVSILRVQPWANPSNASDQTIWQHYTRLGSGQHQDPATSVRKIMQSIIVRHQFPDIDVQLPALHNKCVYLEPTVYDKYNMDLFTLVLACNTITSERTDQDYIFERRNWRSLDLVIQNLRTSNFAWFGYTPKDAKKTYETLMKYKAEHPDMWPSDKLLAEVAESIIPHMVSDETWCNLNHVAEMGFSISNLPSKLAAQCSVGLKSSSQENLSASSPAPKTVAHAVLPATTVIAAQAFVNESVSKGQPDPLSELCNDSPSIAINTVNSQEVLQAGAMSKTSGGQEVKVTGYSGIPKSGFSKAVTLNPKALKVQKVAAVVKSTGRKRRHSGPAGDAMSADRIRLTGTASAKLSYLLSRVIEFQEKEKILIFYEGDNVAYYIAQGLEILGVPHFIYASNIGPKLRSEYHDKFMSDNSPERVMLIDLKQGGQGLTIVSASRIFFVNPVWNASIEAQAIKRAHRIGQTRDVYVETLVLRDSVEEKMLARRSDLNEEEKGLVKTNPLLDMKVHVILKSFRFRSRRGGPDVPEEKRFAPIRPAPLMFPSASEYLRKTAATGQEPSETNTNGNEDGEGEAASTPKKKKVTRFVI